MSNSSDSDQTVQAVRLLLSGRLTRIVVRINLVPIGEELHGDYVNDKNFKRSFQRWLNGLWEEKDRQLTDIMRDKER
ncbi:hypothetical protein NUBL21985_53680 [Klebsiella pneumoniae]|nr:hypothetical protein NUBL21985_53680 [Klebsiella pneumoniae]